MGLKNDTLIYGGVTYPILDLGLAEFHALVMNEKIKQDPEIKMYLRAWKDTLTLDSVQAMEYIEYFNYKFRDEYIDKVKKKYQTAMLNPGVGIISMDRPLSTYLSAIQTKKQSSTSNSSFLYIMMSEMSEAQALFKAQAR